MSKEKLKDCPFCGNHPELKQKGNNFTKKRSVEIRCKNKLCAARQITGALKYSLEWCEEIAIGKWNKRT